MKRRTVVSGLIAVAVAVGALCSGAASARSTSRTITFAGEGRIYELSGTFKVDHFAVKSPVVPSSARPRIVAIGALSATVTSPFRGTPQSFSQSRFAWVDVTVATRCGGNVAVTLDPLGGGDFASLAGTSLWDASVPAAAWDPSVHWQMATAGALNLDGARSCAVARAGSPTVQAAALNAALRENG